MRKLVYIWIDYVVHIADVQFLQLMPGSQRMVTGSNVGKSSISGAISALEKFRLNCTYQHKDDPKSQITLRSDICIRQFEDASKSNEPKRIEQAQMLKAVGTSSGEWYLLLY
jgi:hypothetical protein